MTATAMSHGAELSRALAASRSPARRPSTSLARTTTTPRPPREVGPTLGLRSRDAVGDRGKCRVTHGGCAAVVGRRRVCYSTCHGRLQPRRCPRLRR
jgi:hypothetical protein